MAYSSQSSSTAQEHATNPRTGDLSPHHNNILYMPITSTSVLTGQFPPLKRNGRENRSKRGEALIQLQQLFTRSYPILSCPLTVSYPIPSLKPIRTYPNQSSFNIRPSAPSPFVLLNTHSVLLYFHQNCTKEWIPLGKKYYYQSNPIPLLYESTLPLPSPILSYPILSDEIAKKEKN